jgi:hypothetical protein
VNIKATLADGHVIQSTEEQGHLELMIPIYKGPRVKKVLPTNININQLPEAVKELVHALKQLSYCGSSSNNLHGGKEKLLSALRLIIGEEELDKLWKECHAMDSSTRWPYG